ncbi:dolichol-phosphate mannosyltransferase subunit 3 [Babesia caballi]|uniref:Dolichol-phosphate mannosyltransferase subunit 3 n=1 Tax=Babesia caballi TaxID=5871 RepID=A0AAV4LWV2_BABCB|nr:dolichol-phosphate mannosyltransferase subunit 3 [Babesia caballi]
MEASRLEWVAYRGPWGVDTGRGGTVATHAAFARGGAGYTMVSNSLKAVGVLVVVYAVVWVEVFRRPWSIPVLAFLLMPFALVSGFGVYAVCSILWGVATFNRSETALADLKQDLKLAANALDRVGFDFEKYGVPKP